jgi:hypothetical protein
MHAPSRILILALLCAGMTSAQLAAATTAPVRQPSPPTAASAASATAKTVSAQHISMLRWTSRNMPAGTYVATRPTERGIALAGNAKAVTYDDPYGPGGPRRYVRGRWYSPWVRPGFSYDELIASYNAKTPVGTFIEISVRGRSAAGLSSWDSLGRWASHDTAFHRMSLGAQRDDLGRVSVDTWIAKGAGFHSWRLRVTLMRRTNTTKSPVVTMVGAMSSRLPASMPTSTRGNRPRVNLPVPRFSQELHVGHYPQWNGGGEAWCSPTSTSMVVSYFQRGPTPAQYAWVSHQNHQPWVDYAARGTYASGYDGTGDWPFNTAYAGRWKLDAFVTRLRSLREAEMLVRAGIPVVASIAFKSGQLDGAPIGSTAGHLVVIRGITARGRVIVNDPAAPRNSMVQRVYKRGQFENAWIDTTGGVAYIIHPKEVLLPRPSRHSNW